MTAPPNQSDADRTWKDRNGTFLGCAGGHVKGSEGSSELSGWPFPIENVALHGDDVPSGHADKGGSVGVQYGAAEYFVVCV